MNEEEIRSATVGEPVVHDGPIDLVDYDPAWPRQFALEVRRITGALSERALKVEHVGSTSVPGLVAKPVIDILLVVADSSDEKSYATPLESAGYLLRIREPDWYQHRMFVGMDPRVQIHVFSEGCPEIDRMVLFRDRLRSDPADREVYGRRKRELARRTWRYVQDYADAKGSVVEEIIARGSSPEVSER
ncbi:MAG TPA: GrpB family protein [Actinomycetota bacterium]|nr:GrpB family protein [Actinomycetota bacterium]